MGYKLNLSNPKTFNEKVQWMKVYDHNPLYNKLVDKYEVKNYVSKIIGEEFCVPNYAVWNNVSEINFDQLPNTFVLKTTHDWQGVYIINDKNQLTDQELERIKKGLSNHLKQNLFFHNREWAYKDVQPRIIAEKNIALNNFGEKIELLDYKFYCFNGEAVCLLVCSERKNGSANYYYFDKKGNMLPYNLQSISAMINNVSIELPKNIQKMWKMAEKLSKNIREVRVDMYSVDNKIYVGELTLYSSAGYDKDISYMADMKLGEKFKIDN